MSRYQGGRASGWAFSDLSTWRPGFEHGKRLIPPSARDGGINHPCDGGRSGSEPAGVAVMKPANLGEGYRQTVESLTSMPILRSSGWMRGLPQVGFERHMSRINSRTSRSILGRPPVDRLFHRQ